MIDIVTRLIECAKRAMPNDSGKEHGLAGLCLEAARELENARREAASWEQQASDRTDDAVRFAQERDALKAKVEAMEKQEPAMWANSSNIVSARISRERGAVGDQHSCSETKTAYHDAPLYALPGAQAQPAPVDNDKSVRKAWARFSNELHRSPDAPYPGMAEAFEHHFSQSFTDREWRAESGTWAAAWKAAKHHARASAQAQPAPSVPDLDMDYLERQNDELKEEVGKLRDALALIADQYEPKCSLLIPSIARTALNATGAYGQKEPPESWPTEAMVTAFAELFNVRDQKNTFGPAFRAALAAAPEIKP